MDKFRNYMNKVKDIKKAESLKVKNQSDNLDNAKKIEKIKVKSEIEKKKAYNKSERLKSRNKLEERLEVKSINEGFLKTASNVALFGKVNTLSKSIKTAKTENKKLDLIADQNVYLAAISLSKLIK